MDVQKANTLFSVTKRIWISFIFVLALALGLAYAINDFGSRASHTTQQLVTEQLPKLALIKQLRATLSEHERILYEYYSTTNRTLLWPKITEQDEELSELIHNVNERFAAKVMDLNALYGEIKYIRQSLDKNLGGSNIDWDMARFDLANLTLTREKTEHILADLTLQTEQEAWTGAESAQDQIHTIVRMVLFFSAIIILSAFYVGYYTQQNIRQTAKRRALAKFPERNPNPVMNLNWQGEILFANPACRHLLESLNQDGDQAEILLPPTFYQDLKSWKQSNQTLASFEATMFDHHLHYSLSLLPDLERCHLYIEDVTERKKAKDQLEFQALHDVHTGLPNRRHFELNLSQLIAKSQSCSILFISIDRFKFITSSQGYWIGDQIVKNMGSRLKMIAKDYLLSIRTYRLEGSTFCLLLETDNTERADELASYIQQSMDEPLLVREHRYYLNLSMGICHFPQDGQTAEALITNGNAALNHARVKGDSLEEYSPKLHAEEQSWLPIDAGMRQALERKQFVLHYQGKVDTQSQKLIGAEALIRWQDENGNMVSPARFIPVAEQTGLIIKIGEWVFEEACRQASVFAKEKQDIQLAVNISARQFQHRHFIEHLRRSLERTLVEPCKIELEITESLIMENAAHSIQVMKRLKDMGFALAIDDFGTGYSSLSYLKQFPIDTLKIDQAFIRNLEKDEHDKSIVSAIVDLAKHLKLKTVAEGVETEGQLAFLQELQCDYIQGFLFSKPDRPEALYDIAHGIIQQSNIN